MSRSAQPNKVASVGIQHGPVRVNGDTELYFCYSTPTGIWKRMELTVNVDDILCMRHTINKLAAEYKRLAEELAARL